MGVRAQILARERHAAQDAAIENDLRSMAKGLVAEINEKKGEGHLFLSESTGAGFFTLFERVNKVYEQYREVMWAVADVDGYARLVLLLGDVKEGAATI